MKSILGKLSPRRAVGVYVGDDEIAVSEVAATPLGPVELHHRREPYQPDELGAVLKRALEPLLGKRRRCPVAFGLPSLRVFFSTRPLKAMNVEVSPKALLHEVLRSPNSNVEELAIDLIEASPGKRPVVSIVSSRKKYLSGLLEEIQTCGVRPFRVEPSPCALLRAAEARHSGGRKAKVVMRLFFGEREGLATLSAGGWPLVWRSFGIDEPATPTTLTSTVRTLEAVGNLCGAGSPIDVIMVHGSSAVPNQTDRESFEKQAGARVEWHDGPTLDGESIAFGVAMGCLQPSSSKAFDLARVLKPRETLWELFPWGEVALQIAAIVCLGLFLWQRSAELTDTLSAVQAETARRDWLAPLTDQQLTKEKKESEQRVDAIGKFLSTRIVWTNYTHDLPKRLPANVVLNSLQGLCELPKKGKKDEKAAKSKKSLLLRIGAPIPQDGSAPQEIDNFLDSLRGHPLLKKDFPLVELADIKWYQPFVGAKPTAFFTVICLPKPTAPAGGGETGEKSDKSDSHAEH